MAQYTEGLARVLSTNTSRVVLSGTGATTTDQIQAGDLWRFQADSPGFYTVASVISTVEFALTSPYEGDKALDTPLPYLVTRDFTPNHELAELSPGDVDIREVFTYDIRMIDGLVLDPASSSFPIGTRLLFDQDSAPPGWVRDTTINDRVPMIVSGARNHGGSWTITGLADSGHQHEIPFALHGSVNLAMVHDYATTFQSSVNAGTMAFTTSVEARAIQKNAGIFLSPTQLLKTGSQFAIISSNGSWRPLHRAVIVCTRT